VADAHFSVPHVPRRIIKRFFREILIDRRTGCWLWTGHLEECGYGKFFAAVFGRHVSAHRFVYAWLVAPIPLDGTEIDHVCRRRHCVNPMHLEAVTHDENMRRARRAFCRSDHPCGYVTRPSGERVCLMCESIRSIRYRRALGMKPRAFRTHHRQSFSTDSVVPIANGREVLK